MADEAQSGQSTGSSKPDFATIVGLILAVGGIATGLTLEGGNVLDIARLTSALVVLGGTIGAVMITTPLPVCIAAAKKFGEVFFGKEESPSATIAKLMGYATQARKEGIVSLEAQADAITDPFLRKALSLAVDGIESASIRDIMELEIQLQEERIESEVKVFEAAGGYAPTIGIIGAVLGLIQVMKSLSNIEEVGHGIAAAFVATIYGVASANLIFLPAAGKLRARGRAAIQIRELTLEGVLGIADGVNQKLIRLKLEAYMGRRVAIRATNQRRRATDETAATAEG